MRCTKLFLGRISKRDRDSFIKGKEQQQRGRGEERGLVVCPHCDPALKEGNWREKERNALL